MYIEENLGTDPVPYVFVTSSVSVLIYQSACLILQPTTVNTAGPHVCTSRECCIIYRGPGFLVVVLIGSLPHPSPLSPVTKLDRRHIGRTEKERQLADGGGVRGWARSRIKRPQESLVLYKLFKRAYVSLYDERSCNSYCIIVMAPKS